jgi:hypothetical protein
MDEENKNLSIDLKETEEMVERDRSSSALMRVSLILASVSIFFVIHNIISIGHYLADDSVPLVDCPRSFSLDAPVLMKSIVNEGAQVQDRRLRGFIRRFITAQLPRTEKDVTPFFDFIVNHSKNYVQDRYQSFLNGKGEIANFISSGYYLRFYPKFTLAELGNDPRLTDNSALKIRKSDTPGAYVIEQEGYLVKKMNRIQERTIITLRYEVEVGKPTLHNPEGLYVVGANIDKVTDFISGSKLSEEHF